MKVLCVGLEQVASGAEALDVMHNRCPHPVTVGRGLPGTEPLEPALEMTNVNAVANTAVVCRLFESDFHEAGEGPGILYSRLPEPSKSGRGRAAWRLLKSNAEPSKAERSTCP